MRKVDISEHMSEPGISDHNYGQMGIFLYELFVAVVVLPSDQTACISEVLLGRCVLIHNVIG